MFGLCCFAQSAVANEATKARPPNLLEEPAENLEAFKEGLRSISTPTSSFQKIAPDLVETPGVGLLPPPMPPTSQMSRCKSNNKKKGLESMCPRDIEVFERRQFEAYKEEVEKRRRLQLVERQMALFNTWEFYSEQEMWDLLVRYNQYIQTGHQIFLTPMPDCPIHGHTITAKHQQSKRGHKPHKKLKQRRRPSAGSLSDEQSSPYASHYSDNNNKQGSDRSRSSLTSQVSAEIHSVEKSSMQSVLKIISAVDLALPSDASEKDSGIDKNSINSSIGEGSDRSSRKSLEHALHQHKASPAISHSSDERPSPSPPTIPQDENDYDLDVPPKAQAQNAAHDEAATEDAQQGEYRGEETRETTDAEENKPEPAEYRDYREGIYYAREEVKPNSTFGAMWENRSSPTINTYEDMDLERQSTSRTSMSTHQRQPPLRQRDQSPRFAPPNEPHTEIVYGNQEVEEECAAALSHKIAEYDASTESAIEKYYAEGGKQEAGAMRDCSDLLECKGDQCSPSKVMLRSLNLSSHNLTDIPQSNEGSLERKQAYSRVNKEGMKVYDLTADVRDSSTTPPPPPPVKRIDALIHEDHDFYDDSRDQPESESLVRSIEPSPAANREQSVTTTKAEPPPSEFQALPEIHHACPRAPAMPPSHVRPTVVCFPSRPPTPEQEPHSDAPVVVDEQPRSQPQVQPAIDGVNEQQQQSPVASINVGGKEAREQQQQQEEDATILFDIPKLRDASERKITPITEESDEVSIRTEIQKVITKLHKTGGWRKATCTPGEPYLTLDLRKETKTDSDPVPQIPNFTPLAAKNVTEAAPAAAAAPVSTSSSSPIDVGTDDVKPQNEAVVPPAPVQSQRGDADHQIKVVCSQIDVKALDFKKAREALRKFTNDGSNPLLKQMSTRSVHVLVDEGRVSAAPEVATTLPAKVRLTKTVSAPPNIKTTKSAEQTPPVAPPEPNTANTKLFPEAPSVLLQATPSTEAYLYGARDEDEDRINFKAARETLQKLTSLNNGMFFMTDRKNRQAF